MTEFAGRVTKSDYSALYRASKFDGTYQEYLARHGLSELSVVFDKSVQFDSLRQADGAFIPPQLVSSRKLQEGDRIEGEAELIGGGSHVRAIATVTRRLGQ